MGRPEGLLQVLAGGPEQGPPHVHQTRVDGLDDGQERQATGPALPKVVHRNTVPTVSGVKDEPFTHTDIERHLQPGPVSSEPGCYSHVPGIFMLLLESRRVAARRE